MMSSPRKPVRVLHSRRGRLGLTGLTAAGATVALAALAAVPASAAPAGDRFKVTNLVSDVAGVAQDTDANLVNPWGASELPGSPLWVSDQGTAVSTLYSGDVSGSKFVTVPLVVSIPSGSPTGQVANDNESTTPSDFKVTSGSQSGPALFIFDNLAGQLSAWNPAVDTTAGATSTHAVEVASVKGAVFTGLAIDGATLYAANFAAGKVDVFNSSFKLESTPGRFTDHALPAGFKPFNVAVIHGDVFVAFARANPKTGKAENVLGAGFVDVFGPHGVLLRRLLRGGVLDSPWGMVMAPASFGPFSNDLLVGNFGDGFLNAFSPRTGHFLGAVRESNGRLFQEHALWSLILGDGTAATASTLLFTAGIDNEQHGLLGSIVPAGS
jgi:uncharacterized protein (TIGR03118 family)